jgi:hypothetical protein
MSFLGLPVITASSPAVRAAAADTARANALAAQANTAALVKKKLSPETLKKIEKDRKQKALDKAKAAKEKANAEAAANKKPPTEPLNYRWNLPPHRWSLPVTPKEMHEDLYTDPNNSGLGAVDDRYRRGRIWWYANTKNTYNSNVKGNPKNQIDGDERKYGFQFLWNPETFSTSVSLNTEVTPNPADRFVGVAGAFPSGETISFTIRVDRTNDFACLRNLMKKNYQKSLNLISSAADNPLFEQAAEFYSTKWSLVKGETMGAKIKELIELGTLADIEYIYKAVNGPNWKSISGRKTSDIGYLSATLLRVDIGPSSYVGYINGLTINHLSFSQDMAPMRTDVQISMNLMASAGIASDGRPAAVAPTQ